MFKKENKYKTIIFYVIKNTFKKNRKMKHTSKSRYDVNFLVILLYIRNC